MQLAAAALTTDGSESLATDTSGIHAYCAAPAS